MPDREEPRRRRRTNHLGKIEGFLRSLRDLEADLAEALKELDQSSAPVRLESPVPEPQAASVQSWGGAGQREEKREPRKAADPIRTSDQLGRNCREVPDTGSFCEDDDDSSGESSGYDDSDHTGFSDSTGSDHGSYPCPPRAKCGNQVIVNGQLEVPDCKPDIEAVLRFKPVCRVTDWQCVHTVEGRKIVVTGVVEIGVEYVAILPDQPMHFVHFVVPFHTFFLCPRPLQAIRCEVEFKHCELLNPRTISKVILLNVRGVEEK